MPATSPNQISSRSSAAARPSAAALSSASAGRNLAVATAIACVVAVACRWLAPVISHDPAELDGFVFLTAVYWVYSVVGYFASVSKSRRQRRATGSRSLGFQPDKQHATAAML